MDTKIFIPLQIDFAKTLITVRGKFLQEALARSVTSVSIKDIDSQLHMYAPKAQLAKMASLGLRGELLFAVPCLLRANPMLLGYYRLLLGFSQKAFYVSRYGLSIFKAMEENGRISSKCDSNIENLCSNLNLSAAHLLDGIGVDLCTANLLHDLTLLSFGAQLRGGANNRFGALAIFEVFEIIKSITKDAILKADEKSIEIRSAARRTVMIELASDPDIIIQEQMAEDAFRKVIAIEIKGGKDFSNIHNRIGEAEKSHQKARLDGFVECWTVVNVSKMDTKMARMESPSTNRFYILSRLKDTSSTEFIDFRHRIISLTGISDKKSEKIDNTKRKGGNVHEW
jgi:hypothetical protein